MYMRKQTQISCAVTAQLISTFVFATWIVQSLFYLNPKFQASNYLLWVYSPVCVEPGWKPQRLVFSRCGSFAVYNNTGELKDIHSVEWKVADSL